LARLALNPYTQIDQRVSIPCPGYKILSPDGRLIADKVFLRKVPRNIDITKDLPEEALRDFLSQDRFAINYSITWNDYALLEIEVAQNVQPLELDSFDTARDQELFVIGFPRKIDRNLSDRSTFLEELARDADGLREKRSSLAVVKNSSDWSAKVEFCKNGIHWDRLVESAKRGINRAVYEGNREACDLFLAHEIFIVEQKLLENVRYVQRIQYMPVVPPAAYDMPDGSVRWSKGTAILSGDFMDWGTTPCRAQDIDPSYGIVHDVDSTHGNSGGPILNQAGRVVGMISRSAHKEFFNSMYGNWNYSVSSQRLIAFLRDVE